MEEIKKKNLKELICFIIIGLALAVAARVARAGNIDSIVKNENTAAKASYLNSVPRHCLLLSIHGTLSEDGTLEIPPIFRFKGYYEPPGSGDYYVEAYSDTKLLSKTYFRVQPFFGPPGMRQAILGFTVPYDESLTKLVFKHKQKILKEIVRTKNPPKIKIISFSEQDNIVNLKWHYSDPDGEDIACRVKLDCDNRGYKPPVAFLRCSDFPSYNLDMSNFPPYMEIKNLDLSHFPGGDKCCLRIEVSDGINIGKAYSPRFSLDKQPQADREICNKRYRLVSPDGEKTLGTYGIKAVLKEAEMKIEIVESMSLDYRGKKAEMKSIVIYDNRSPISPKKGTAETTIDGKVCMEGMVAFSEKNVDFECTGFLNKRTGEAIDPPKKFEKKNEPKPKGILIFQSALPAIGPRILPKEGELKNVVFVEFPDDLGAPELINFKEGYRLVRGKPDEKGEYNMKIYSRHSEDSISHVRFNKDDQIVSIASFGKMKLVEIEEKKK